MQQTARRSQPATGLRRTTPWRSFAKVSGAGVLAEVWRSGRNRLSARREASWFYLLWAKRPFDLLLSGLGLLGSAPLWALIALAIKFNDRGPVFYGQERVGRGGKRFWSWKFRSMIPDSDARFGPLQAGENDPRVTWVGHLLRATALDELPQLWNIFKGDMSFVGPRALLAAEIEVNGNGELMPLGMVPGYEARHRVRPGLTGVAQIYAPRDIPRKHKFKYDLLYIKKHSFWLDLRLIALSFWITFRGRWEVRGRKY